jgi:hypothetical protein
MSQCHDIYSWDTYHGRHCVAPEGTQCHDPDDPQPPETSVSAPRDAEEAVEAADRELQPA